MIRLIKKRKDAMEKDSQKRVQNKPHKITVRIVLLLLQYGQLNLASNSGKCSQ